MTLQSSGSMTAAQIASELRTTVPITISGSSSNIVNWLAERNGSSVTIPTHLYNKAAVKLVDLATTSSNQATTVTFNGLSFGPAFSGRRLIACTFLWATSSQVLNISTVTIGGSSTSGNDGGEFSGSETAASGVFMNAASGTSGTVAINFGGGTASGAAVAVLSVAGISTTNDTLYGAHSGSGAASFSGSISLPTNGVSVSAVCRANTSGISWTGNNNELVDQTVDTSFRIGVAFENRYTSGSKTVGFSSTGTVATGFVAKSYS